MRADLEHAEEHALSRTPPRPGTQTEQDLDLFTSGVNDVEALADITGCRPSYVASVLQDADLLKGYFDLYTTSERPMNVYSQHFAGQLGFRDEEAARESVRLLDQSYREFERS